MTTFRRPFTLRLTPAQCSLVSEFADGLALPDYQARIRIFERGLASAFSNQQGQSSGDHLTLLADILAQLEGLTRLAERNLFVGASAYIFAANAAHRGISDSEALNASLSKASLDAYRRQLEIARGGS